MDYIWCIENGSFRAEIDVRELHALPLNNIRKLLKLSKLAGDSSFDLFLVLLDRAIRSECDMKKSARLKKILMIYLNMRLKH